MKEGLALLGFDDLIRLQLPAVPFTGSVHANSDVPSAHPVDRKTARIASQWIAADIRPVRLDAGNEERRIDGDRVAERAKVLDQAIRDLLVSRVLDAVQVGAKEFQPAERGSND